MWPALQQWQRIVQDQTDVGQQSRGPLLVHERQLGLHREVVAPSLRRRIRHVEIVLPPVRRGLASGGVAGVEPLGEPEECTQPRHADPREVVGELYTPGGLSGGVSVTGDALFRL